LDSLVKKALLFGWI